MGKKQKQNKATKTENVGHLFQFWWSDSDYSLLTYLENIPMVLDWYLNVWLVVKRRLFSASINSLIPYVVT